MNEVQKEINEIMGLGHAGVATPAENEKFYYSIIGDSLRKMHIEGTEKQAKWVKDIIDKKIKELEHKGYPADFIQIIEQAKAQKNATWWIGNREKSLDELFKPLDTFLFCEGDTEEAERVDIEIAKSIWNAVYDF